MQLQATIMYSGKFHCFPFFWMGGGGSETDLLNGIGRIIK